MNTTAIRATYTLTDDAYRAEVAAATGPVPRDREAMIPIGDLTPEARLALLEIWSSSGPASKLCSLPTPTVNTGSRATAPTTADVSARLLVMRDAEIERRAIGAAREAELEAGRKAKAEAQHATIEAWLASLETDPSPAIVDGRWNTLHLAYGVHGDGHGCPTDLIDRLQAIRLRTEARLAAEAEAEARRLAGLEIEARAWAAERGGVLSPELQRAAREGRTVLPEIQRRVHDVIEETLVSLTTGPCGIPVYGEEVRNDVPTAAAYALSDMLAAAAPAISTAAVIPHVGIEIGPISRFDVAPRGDDVWRTGVRVSASHPWLDYPATRLGPSWVLLSEPIDQPEDEDED